MTVYFIRVPIYICFIIILKLKDDILEQSDKKFIFGIYPKYIYISKIGNFSM